MDVEIHQVPEDLNLSFNQLEKIIRDTCQEISLTVLSISYIFVSDAELAKMHSTFLQDSSVTDVITFNLGEKEIEGEIYISSERAKIQALSFKVAYEAEIIRLMIHGILHLAGYDDIDELNQKKMKVEEDRLVNKMISLFRY